MQLIPRRRRGNGGSFANPADPAYRQNNHGRVDALTASAARITSGTTDELRRLIQPWQQRAFFYYDALGAINFAAQYYSRGLAPLQLYAGKIQGYNDGVPDVQPTQDAPAVAQLERIQDPGGGGRRGLLASYGRLMFLAGEARLTCSLDPETGIEQWEMLSSDELRTMPGRPPTYARLRAPSLQPDQLKAPADDDYEPLDPREVVVYRIWQRHPQYSGLADATMRGALDTCQEIVGLTQAVRARIRSRLAGAGILFLDDRVSFGSPAESGTDDDATSDPLMAAIIEAITAPLSDEGSAASVAPMLVRVPVPTGENMKIADLFYHLEVRDPTELYSEMGMLMQSFQRLAIELDMPPEVLMGTGDVNHWGAWQIDEQSWKVHLQPKADQLVADLTASFFQPTLREMGVADWNKYVIAYDASKVINHPNRNQDAKDGHDRLVISDDALRDVLGFSATDAPAEKEYLRRLGEKIRDGGLAVYGTPTIRGGDIEVGKGEVEQAGDDPPASASTTDKAPPAPPTDAERQDVSAGANTFEVARVVGACEVALVRCRELAGNRIRSLAKRDQAVLALTQGVPASAIAAVVGPDGVRALGEDERSLIRGYEESVRAALLAWRINGAVSDRIVELVGQHAARTLYAEHAALPPQVQSFVAGILALDRDA